MSLTLAFVHDVQLGHLKSPFPSNTYINIIYISPNFNLDQLQNTSMTPQYLE